MDPGRRWGAARRWPLLWPAGGAAAAAARCRGARGMPAWGDGCHPARGVVVCTERARHTLFLCSGGDGGDPARQRPWADALAAAQVRACGCGLWGGSRPRGLAGCCTPWSLRPSLALGPFTASPRMFACLSAHPPTHLPEQGPGRQARDPPHPGQGPAGPELHRGGACGPGGEVVQGGCHMWWR